MDDEPEERLDSLFMNVDDFLREKNRMSPDKVDMDIAIENCELDFYKPGFDMAFVLLDKTLYNKIGSIQQRFQSNIGMSTHCILLQDPTKIKSLIKDLRQSKVLYAVVVDLSSISDNSYDLYVLYPYIEVNKQMVMFEMYELVNQYYNVLLDHISKLKSNSHKDPHERHIKNDGFVPLSDELRHLFCLLYDGRMLSTDELYKVKDYLMIRKKALKNADPHGIVKYNRPVESMRNDINKYAFYEPMSIIRDNQSVAYAAKNTGAVDTTHIYDHSLVSDTDYSHAVITKRPTLYNVEKPTTIPVPPKSLPPPPIPPAVLLQQQKQNQISPQKQSQISPQKNHPFAQNKSKQNEQPEKGNSNEHDLNRSELKGQRIRFSIGSMKDRDDVINFDKSDSTSTSQSHSTSKLNKTTQNKPQKSSEGVNSPMHYELSPVSSPDLPVSQKRKTNLSTTTSNTDAISSSSRIQRESSKRKSDSLLKSSVDKQAKLSSEVETINLLDTEIIENIDDDMEMSNEQSTDKYVENTVISDYEDDNEEPMDIGSIQVINLLKLALELSMLKLPDNNVMSKTLHQSCEYIKSNIPDENLSNIIIDYESCKEQGFIEIINDIHELCDSVSPNFSMFAELDYLWAMLFPSSPAENHILVLFYRYIKLLVLFKAFNEYQDALDSLSKTSRRISRHIYFDLNAPFSLPFPNVSVKKPKHNLNTLPKLFNIYMQQVHQIHTYSNFNSNTKNKPLLEKNDLQKCDQMILNAKIKFQTFPMFNYFFEKLNSINCHISMQQIKILYECIRTLRFCLRKMKPEIVNSQIEKPIIFDMSDISSKSTVYKKKEFDGLKKEVHTLIKELVRFKPVVFTDKHYEFLNYILDCCLKIENTILSPNTGLNNSNNDDSWCISKSDSLGRYHVLDFMNEFLNQKPSVSSYYHSQSELGCLRSKLQEHWKVLIHRALRIRSNTANTTEDNSNKTDRNNLEVEPDGSRIYSELRLLPSIWREQTFAESVTVAVQLYSAEWDKVARTDTKNNFNIFCMARNNGLFWFEKNRLPMAKILEELSKCQSHLDRLFLELLENN